MIESRIFGTLPDGQEVNLYAIRNSYGEFVELIDFGASIHSIFVKDAYGKAGDVVLGVNNASELGRYAPEGVTIGRCAGRIAFGRYELNGKTFQLEKNSGEHQLHSGSGCYAFKMFRAETDESRNTISFYFRDTAEGGFDCEADVSVIFTFGDDHRLEIQYEITPDDDTIINPANHAYFNLAGTEDARDHQLRIFASEYAPKGDIGMPVGEIRPVAGTPLDFTQTRTLRDAMAADKEEFFTSKNVMVDDTFILSKEGFGLAAELSFPKNGRIMKVYTDMPALVLFTPTFPMPGKDGKPRQGYSSLCLETQFVPNAVNCPQYRSPICRKGNTFISRTVFEFTTKTIV